MQTRIPIFNDLSFSDILEEMGIKNLNIKINNRLKKSWRIEKVGSHFTLSLPQKLINSPQHIKQELISWTQTMIQAKLAKSKLPQDIRKSNLQRERLIFEYMIEEGEVNRFRTYKNHKQKFRDTSGVCFDLEVLFTSLNNEWFGGTLHSYLRWGKYGSKTSYHSLFHDDTGNTHHLITIAGLYNHPAVPQYAVEAVLYHEMLHIALPPIESDLRRNVHHRAFREAEQQFVHYEKWQKWLKKKAYKLYRRGF